MLGTQLMCFKEDAMFGMIWYTIPSCGLYMKAALRILLLQPSYFSSGQKSKLRS